MSVVLITLTAQSDVYSRRRGWRRRLSLSRVTADVVTCMWVRVREGLGGAVHASSRAACVCVWG